MGKLVFFKVETPKELLNAVFFYNWINNYTQSAAIWREEKFQINLGPKRLINH